ncbi:MAG: NUDIX hydrolase [Deltaproteobacteria bacterium]|nr:NUDIX hydrolase [Deltaproteobacteria bacterium]
MRETFYCPHCDQPLIRYRNPVPTVDILIAFAGGLVLIERLNPPPGWALPGGFVDYGESLEAAAVREAYEETGLTVELTGQFHTYSDPARDPRQHTISTVFTARGRGRLLAGDDAGKVAVYQPDNLPSLIAFDHRQIINEYFKSEILVK